MAEMGPLKEWEIPYYLGVFYDKVFAISDFAYSDEYKSRGFIPERTDPLRLVTVSAKDCLLESNGFRKRFHEFRIYDVYNKTGISFDDWIARPPYELDMYLNDLRIEFANIEKARAEREREEDMSLAAHGYGQYNDQMIGDLQNGSKYRP